MDAIGSAGPHVRLTSGSVRGRTEDGLAVFRGMPFARPPVGELRLAVPMPVEPWEGVREAVAFGVPHTAWGEEVAAAVTLNGDATEAELLAYCKERLADFKRPKQIHITTTIPRTATGKIQRRIVARAFAPQAK